MMVVIITHRMGVLPVTNKIAIMRNGTVAAGDSERIYETFLQAPSKPEHRRQRPRMSLFLSAPSPVKKPAAPPV